MRYLALLAAAGLILAVSGTAEAIVTWTIDIDHGGSALTNVNQVRTGYFQDGTWSWTVSAWHSAATLPDTYTDPPGSNAQLYGQMDHNTYLDVRARAGMEPTWWMPAIPTTSANLSYTFDFPYASSVSLTSNSLKATLADNWGDTYGGTGYVQIMGQHEQTAAEAASALWWTILSDGKKHSTARYALSYDAPSNTYNSTTYSWSDFPWADGDYWIDLLLVETGLTIGNGTGLIEEITVTGGEVFVPEPLTILGMFLGLGSVGAYIRRRRLR